MTIDTNFLRQLYANQSQEKTFPTSLTAAPTSALPIITSVEVADGFVTRYFIRSVTDTSYILEIDKRQYELFKQNPRFVTTQVKWKIVGKTETTITEYGAKNLGVRDYNILQVSKADLTFGGLQRYIRNYLEYWLYDENGERILPSPTPTPSTSQARVVRYRNGSIGASVGGQIPPQPTPSATLVPSATPQPTPSITPSQTVPPQPTPTITPSLVPTDIDYVDAGLTLTRGVSGGLYNSETESGWDFDTYASPQGTLWNSVFAVGAVRLEDVSCISADNCVVVGDDGFITRWNGMELVDETSGVSSRISEVVCINANDCVAIADTSILRWDGTSWSTQYTYMYWLWGVTCLTSNFCVAVGASGGSSSPPASILIWNGSTWTFSSPPAIPSFTTLRSVYCIDSNNCVAVGGGNIIRWDGSTWTIEYQNGNIGQIWAVTCLAADDCFATTTNGDLLRWNGTSWSVENITANQLFDIACTSTNNCVAVGDSIILRWNGSMWNTELTPSVQLRGITCLNANDCIAVGETNTILRWNGSTWSEIELSTYGWSDLTNVTIRTYDTFTNALNFSIGLNAVDTELVMHDTINDKYYKFDITFWGQGGIGTFAYTRQEIDTITGQLIGQPVTIQRL
jgi:hypothetical protein